MSTRCPELASIRKVVDLYIDGVQNGNLDSMRQAFHPQSSMFGYKGQDLRYTDSGVIRLYCRHNAPGQSWRGG